MATITPQDAAEDGGITFAAADVAGDLFANNGKTLIVVHNGGAGAVTFGVTAQSTSTTKDGFGPVTKASVSESIAAGDIGVFGPFPAKAFNNSSGQVAVTYSGVTSVEVAVVRVTD